MSWIDDIIGLNRRNLDFVYAKNPRRHFPLVDNKALTKKTLAALGIPVPKPVIDGVDRFGDIPDAVGSLEGRDSFVIKPARGRGGGGILVVTSRTKGGWQTPSARHVDRRTLEHHMGEILFGVYSGGAGDRDSAIVETYLTAHPMLHAVYPRGVADIRVIVVDGQIVMAMLRIPTNASDGKANLHQGGLGVPIDLANGALGPASYRNQTVREHPDTGEQIAGRTIPRWGDVREISLAAAAAVPLGFLGVDIVLEANLGPVVLELNARPGLQIQVVNQKSLGEALREACG